MIDIQKFVLQFIKEQNKDLRFLFSFLNETFLPIFFLGHVLKGYYLEIILYPNYF